MDFSIKSQATASVAALTLTTALLGLAGCDHATPPQATPSRPPAAIAQAPTMQTGVEAINACKANGLTEATCTQVYHDMMAGRPPQGAATLADCEAKYGAGQCGNNPVPTASGTGNVFLPLVAGAALGALGGYLLSKNLAPKGAYVPPTDWLKNRPSISASQNPVAGAAAKASPYAQVPGTYKVAAPNVAGTVGTAATQFTPPAGGPKTSAAVPPAAQSAASFKQGSTSSPYAAGGGTSPQYGTGGGYNYRAPQSMRPGARSLGRRR